MFTFLRRLRGPVTTSHLSAGLLPKTLVSTLAASEPSIAVFWDLDNKPPNSIPPTTLPSASSSLPRVPQPLRFCVAYANHHAFRHVPPPVRSARASHRALDRHEVSHPSPEPYPCRVCGRNFVNAKLVHHFREIHEREHAKRLRLRRPPGAAGGAALSQDEEVREGRKGIAGPQGWVQPR